MNQDLKTKELISLIIALDDLREAELACRSLLDLKIAEKHQLYQPILTALIVSYSRPLKKSHKLNSLGLDLLSWQNEDQKKLHAEIIGLRDTAIAHSDKAMHLIRVFPLFDTNGARKPGLIGTHLISSDLRAIHLPNILEMIHELKKRIEAKRDTLLHTLYPAESIPDEGVALEI